MKAKILTLVLFACVSQLVSGQEKNNSTTELQSSYNNSSALTDYHQAISPEQKVNTKDASYENFDDKKWKRTIRKIQRNKKRLTNNKEAISYKVMDTIFLNVSKLDKKSRLSFW